MIKTNERHRSVRCEPLASLASRRRGYWREVLSVLGMLVLVAAVASALCLAAVKLFGASWLNAAFVCAAIMAPPVWMLWPDYPTNEDVERDRALRRDAGLPDDVERE